MAEALELLTADGVRLGCTATDRADAIRQTGALLVELGAVEQPYVDAMQEREEIMSSFVGEAFALPHGTDASRAFVRRACLVFLQFPEGVDWDGEDARVCIGIAAARDEHVSVMANVARILIDPVKAEELRTAVDAERVLALLTPQAAEAATEDAH